MLEEIMRRGTSSFGRDVPSEREINRLAARSEEEFWMFEKMDEERRMKESYRTRLMEDHEVPEWAYSAPNQEEKAKKDVFGSVTGKRKRRDVSYSDSLSDLQWMKAVENGDVSKLSLRQRENHDTATGNNNASAEERMESGSGNKTVGGKNIIEVNNDDDDDSSTGSEEEENETGSSEMNQKKEISEEEDIFAWNTHRRKRSRYVTPNGRGD